MNGDDEKCSTCGNDRKPGDSDSDGEYDCPVCGDN